MNKASIIIPTLNEAENIDPLLSRVFDVVESSGLDVEVLIADGGSSDGTEERVRAWERNKPVRLIRSDGKRGLSGDVQYAASQAQCDVVAVMDADLSHPPDALPDLLAPVLDGSHEMVIGSRYVRGGGIAGWPWHRRLFSKAATLLAWPLVSVRDPMAGFFAVKRQLLISFGSMADGYKIGLEIMAQSDDTLRVKEVPITFTDRERGASKLGSRVVLTYLRQIIRLAGGTRIEKISGRTGAAALACAFVDLGVFKLLAALGCSTNLSQLGSFAAAAAAVYYFFVVRTTGDHGGADQTAVLPTLLRYGVICLLALFLRSAVIQVLIMGTGLHPWIALVGGTVAAAVVLLVGTMFFVLPNPDSGEKPGIRWRTLAIAAAVYSLLLRLLYAGIIQLIPEEAYYWNYGHHLDLSYLDHPSMVGWLNYLGTWLFGNRELVVRTPAILCWCITVYFLYHLTRNLFDKTAALIAVLMVSVLPIYIGTGFFMTPDPPLYAAWMGTLYFLSRALLENRHRAWIGVGACLGLGMISKYTIALLVPAILIFILLHIRGRTRFTLLRPELYAGAILSILIFLPVVIWNAEHSWASFAFQGGKRFSGKSHFYLYLLILNILVVITPLGAAAVWRTLFPRGGRIRSVLQDIDHDGARLSFVRVFTLFPLAVFVIQSIQGLSKLNWTGPVWLVSLPLLGGVLSGLTRSGTGGGKPVSLSMKGWYANSAGCLLLLGGVLFFVAAGMPGAIPEKGMPVPIGWKEMASQIDSIPMRGNPNGSPLVVGMDTYWIASEYSFYMGPESGKEPAGRQLVGKDSLMWSYWLDKGKAGGRDAIMVSFKRKELEGDRIGKYFEKLGKIVDMPIMKNGRAVAMAYYRKGYSYKPPI